MRNISGGFICKGTIRGEHLKKHKESLNTLRVPNAKRTGEVGIIGTWKQKVEWRRGP